MNLREATIVAGDVLSKISPACQRSQIAGSVRRKKLGGIHDIELVVVPKISPVRNLFGEVQYDHNHLEQVIYKLGSIYADGPRLKKIRLEDFGYLQENGVRVEIYIVIPPAQFGVIYTLRTGPREFSTWCVSQRNIGGQLPSHLYVKDGAVWEGGQRVLQEDGSWAWQGGEIVPTPEERDFFEVLELGWIEPEKRRANWRR